MIRSVLDHIPAVEEGHSIPVLHADELSEHEFRRHYVDKNMPCLIKGAVTHWPASSKWKDLQYLKDSCGNHRVQVFSDINFIDTDTMQKHCAETSFAEAIDRLSDPSREIVSLPAVGVEQTGNFAALDKDIGKFAFISKLPKPVSYLQKRFFLYKNAGTGWHNHPVDETLMCQVVGSKRVGLMTTKNSAYEAFKQMAKADEYLQGSERLDALKKDINVQIVTVKEGDVLYIPPHWWHGVDPVDANVGMTLAVCFRSPLHKISDLSYPAVRDIWVAIVKHPSLFTLYVPLLGLATFFGQIAYRIKCLCRK